MTKQSMYECEVTDTFGGEANYCWVRRYRVKARSTRGAITKVAREMGYSGRVRKTYSGECTRHDVAGACVCIFTQWHDPEYPGEFDDAAIL